MLFCNVIVMMESFRKDSTLRTTLLRLAALIIVFINFPLILFSQFLWSRVYLRLVTAPAHDDRVVPGSLGLPLMGETLSYLLDRYDSVYIYFIFALFTQMKLILS